MHVPVPQKTRAETVRKHNDRMQEPSIYSLGFQSIQLIINEWTDPKPPALYSNSSCLNQETVVLAFSRWPRKRARWQETQSNKEGPVPHFL